MSKSWLARRFIKRKKWIWNFFFLILLTFEFDSRSKGSNGVDAVNTSSTPTRISVTVSVKEELLALHSHDLRQARWNRWVVCRSKKCRPIHLTFRSRLLLQTVEARGPVEPEFLDLSQPEEEASRHREFVQHFVDFLSADRSTVNLCCLALSFNHHCCCHFCWLIVSISVLKCYCSFI